MKIEELPDYPAVRSIARALWGTVETRGAAVMVGAGFSRFAQLPTADTPPPPLWSDFEIAMIQELYGEVPADAPRNPLRIAEEYRAQAGQVALETLVRRLVADESWEPGALHDQLLGLPWADVLTTNWDTLLERAAARNVERDYERILTTSDIARTRAPRIVKLHGSFPTLAPFILAEEDFRRYPNTHAPFVNFARQALLENELCMLGFSGDDPNFLEWSGWVRDHLDENARKIHLVGVLNLSPSRRRMLEQRNVSIVDLAPLVEGHDMADQHRRAMEHFLEALRESRPPNPWKWSRWKSPDAQAGSGLTEILAGWQADRKAYPGWLVAPRGERDLLRSETVQHLLKVQKGFTDASPETRRDLLAELVWRCQISFWPISSWTIARIDEVVSDTNCLISRSDRLRFAMARLEHGRFKRDKEVFDLAASWATAEASTQDERAEIAYARCLWHRDRLDHRALSSVLEEVNGTDPVWKLRRAALASWLGRHDEATALVRETALDIRKRRARDRRSLSLISREAWCRYAMHVNWLEFDKVEGDSLLQDWPLRYREAECDPWDEFNDIDDATQRAIQKQEEFDRTEEVLFDPGSRRRYDRSLSAWSDGSVLSPFHELRSIVDVVGIPSGHHFTSYEGRLARAAQCLPIDDPTTLWHQALSITNYTGGLIDAAFNRIKVALLPIEEVRNLAICLKTAIDYGRSRLWGQRAEGDERSTSWLDKVRCQMELLSRLTVRLPSQEAETYFRWGLKIAHDPAWRHWWLYEGLDNLLERSLSAIPTTRYPEFIQAMIDLPFSHEKDSDFEREWPELARTLSRLSGDVVRPPSIWESRIAAIVRESHARDRFRRTSALFRLLVLQKAGVLSPGEQQTFAASLWGMDAQGLQLPRDTEFYPHVFLELPELRPGQAADAFEAAVVDALASGEMASNLLLGLSSAASPQNGEKRYKLSRDKALAMAEHLTRSPPPPAPSKGRPRDHAVGYALANAILPALGPSDVPADLPDKLLPLAEKLPAVLLALPVLVLWNPANESAVVRLIRRGMASREDAVATLAAHAVHRWAILASEGGPPVPPRIVASLINLCDFRRGESLQPALKVARSIAELCLMNVEEEEHLVDALDVLFEATAYGNQTGGDLEAITLSLVRAECVRLAKTMAAKGRQRDERCVRWIEAASSDPLPEVRFALEEAGYG